MGTLNLRLLALAAALVVSAGASPLAARDLSAKPAPLAAGDRYVAMGSSYAAGLSVGPAAPDGPTRCGHGSLSYPRLLAKHLSLTLADASCSGSTTEHILGPWNEVPPQIEAVTAETRLVTITSGGNDVSFVSNLFAIACPELPEANRPGRCPLARWGDDAEWAAVEARMHQIVVEVRRRAPAAQIVFVDYPAIVPPSGGCAALLGSAKDLAASRAQAQRLAALTARVARSEKVLLLRASRLTARHTPCAADPWSYGSRAPTGGAPLHPNTKAHAAIAEALIAMLAPHK